MSVPSLRKSLLIHCGTGVGLLLCGLSAGIYLSVKQNLYQELDNSVEQTAAMLANQVELENGAITFEWQEGVGTNPALNEGGIFQFWKEGTDETARSPALGKMNLKKFSGTDEQPQRRSIDLPSGNRARAIGLRIHPFVLPEELERMKTRGQVIDPKSISFVLVVARDSEHIHRTLERLRFVLVGGSLVTMIAGFLLIDRAIRFSLRPINDLTRQVRNRTAHQLDSALDVPGATPAELVGLAKNLDTLLARLASVRRRERDFIRHAAHELRTPIAGLRATTELALSKDRTPREYREHLATCQSTAMELGELIKRLSALARIGRKVEPHALQTFDLVDKLGSCLEPFRGLFQERGLILETDTGGGNIPVTGDPSLTRIIFNNLFDNALCYTRPGGTIQIQASETADAVEIRVSNSTDTPLGEPEHWFEPLFRKNPSREDAESHIGIGLTLSLNAANAMGWTLHAEMPHEDWIEFVLRIPRLEREVHIA